jgi:hypothetical protein
MTRDEILNMPEGEEIDRLVAAAIGATEYDHDFTDPGNCSKCHRERDWHSGRVYPDGKMTCDIPDLYSTDIAAAWEVVEKISEQKNAQVYICTNFSSEFGDTFYVEIYKNWDGEQEQILTSATAETAPLAICRVALLATEALP